MVMVVLKRKDDWWYIRKLSPIAETDLLSQAKRFDYEEAKRVIHIYGLEKDYEIYELN